MPLADARPIAFVITRDRKAAEAFYGETLGPAAACPATISPRSTISPACRCG